VQYQSQRTRLIWTTLAAALFLVAPDVSAHHSSAPYDLTRDTVIEGTATKFDFVNPHGNIELDVLGESGKVEHWTVTIESTVFLRRKGWAKDTLKSGDKIIVSGNRARDGSLHLRGISVQLPDGRKLPAVQ
jgi:hypothetical protein